MTLADHANSSETLEKISASKWDFVALQEQSQIPAVDQSRDSQMYPAARFLVNQIIEAGGVPILFLTWAYRDGWPENGFPDSKSMQFQIDRGYLKIAHELSTAVAPVGYAWLLAAGQNPRLTLWQEDGSHPTLQGTYLAACVFYAAIFLQSPVGLSYRADLPKETALFLQQIAGNTVLNNPADWNLSP
jgi:hypothetical protein